MPEEIVARRVLQWDWPLQRSDGAAPLINNDQKFQVGLEMYLFSAREIEVKVMENDLIIHCCREVPSGSAYGRCREIHRCYKLPSDIDRDTLQSTLTPQGILLITADKFVYP